jgi:acetyl esterase/lipase
MNLMTSADLAGFANPPPDARIHYGDEPLQIGDLRLPPGDGPHPVAIFIHGGCWKAEFDIKHSSKLTAALAESGIATWSLEYRRVGNEGGGWPGTFIDVGRGADHLRAIAETHSLDLGRVIAMGHSAGGHLALWLAARSRIPADVAIGMDNPIALRGVLAMAPAADLAYLHFTKVCDHVVDGLMGGSPEDVPERYRWADPVRFGSGNVPQLLLFGKYDDDWNPAGQRYLEAARARGDHVSTIVAGESGHFEMIDPDSTTWPVVLAAARDMLDAKPAPTGTVETPGPETRL